MMVFHGRSVKDKQNVKTQQWQGAIVPTLGRTLELFTVGVLVRTILAIDYGVRLPKVLPALQICITMKGCMRVKMVGGIGASDSPSV